MDIENELELVIKRTSGKLVGTGDIRIDWLARDCLNEIRRLKAELARVENIPIATATAYIPPIVGYATAFATPEDYALCGEQESVDYTVFMTCPDCGDSLNQSVADEQLRKRNIPMPVVVEGNSVSCPACGYQVHGGNYHEGCGQRLDWGEQNG